MKHLYFARHGLSELNLAGLFAGHSDTPLSAQGRTQAKATGKAAKKFKIDLIVCSPLSRAKETAEIIAKEIGYPVKDIRVNKLLIERYYGALEEQPYFQDANYDYDEVEGIEKSDALLKRGRKALDFLETLPEEKVLVVAHGQIGRAIRHFVLEDFPYNTDQATKLPFGTIVQWL